MLEGGADAAAPGTPVTLYQYGITYDADGNRVGKGTITQMSCDLTSNGYQPTNDYVLDLGSAQMTEVAISESTATWQHTNVSADGIKSCHASHGMNL
jgi:hypothetical protein